MAPTPLSDIVRLLTAISSPLNLAHCSSSLSMSFVQHLASLLPPDPALTLSIGSGSGLLEALLLHQRPALNLKAVELPKVKNIYMPVDKMAIVNGDKDICPLAADASAWMFVYPREALLLQQYVLAFGNAECKLIIWVGEKADLPELEHNFLGKKWIKEDIEKCGLKDDDLMTLWRRHPSDKANSKKANSKATDNDHQLHRAA